jgi:G:T-mismatch repair DNA endonuclease (very short patch repair protein)
MNSFIKEYNNDNFILDNLCEKYKILTKGYKQFWHLIDFLYEKNLISEKFQEKKNNPTSNIRLHRRKKGSETIPEKIFREKILEKNKIKFLKEKYLNSNKFKIDYIILPNIAIEIQGDYWHGNPKFYPDENKLNTVQSKNILRDIKKEKWLIDNNYRYVAIWQNDLELNIDKIEENILLLLDNEGVYYDKTKCN